MLDSSWNETSRLWEALSKAQPGTDVYDQILNEISHILEVQDTLYGRAAEPTWYQEVLTSPIFIGGVFQLAATLIVVNHETVGVITTKAFNWVRFR